MNKFKERDKYFDTLMDKSPSRYQILEMVKNHFNGRTGLVGAEIGVFKGAFSKKINEYINFDKFHLIDIWDSEFEYNDGTQISKQDREYIKYIYECVLKDFSDKKYNIIKASSEVAADRFENNSLDFIYIDGNHQQCDKDLQVWYPKLKPNGIIAGHDYYKKVKNDVDNFFYNKHTVVKSKIPQWLYVKNQSETKESLCCILNYNNNENADFFYKEFGKYLDVCVLDSNSQNPYPYFKNVGNNFYTGLFNNAIEKFKQGNWKNLILITSDVVMSTDAIKYAAVYAKEDMNSTGIWSLQSDITSRDYHNPYNKIPTNISNNSYKTSFIEGFFNIINGDVVRKHSTIPLEINKYGVCITEYSCAICKELNKDIIIDTNYLIHHPDNKGYNGKIAHSYDNLFRSWYKEILRIKDNPYGFKQGNITRLMQLNILKV